MVIDSVKEIFFRVDAFRVGIAGYKQRLILTNLVAEITESELLFVIEAFLCIGSKGRCVGDRLVRRVKIE